MRTSSRPFAPLREVSYLTPLGTNFRSIVIERKIDDSRDLLLRFFAANGEQNCSFRNSTFRAYYPSCFGNTFPRGTARTEVDDIDGAFAVRSKSRVRIPRQMGEPLPVGNSCDTSVRPGA